MSAEHHNPLLRRPRPGPELMANGCYVHERVRRETVTRRQWDVGHAWWNRISEYPDVLIWVYHGIAETSRHRCLFSSSKTSL
jgi:hypothetical protein